MKTIALKLDNFLLDLVTKEAQIKKTTRMELIRSALVSFLVHGDDASDLEYIKQHKKDRLLSFEETFSKS